MTKFEEEVKRPKKAYIDPFSKRDVDFTGVAKKFTEGAQTLKEWKEYAFLLEDKLKLQQQALPVVPKCVAGAIAWDEQMDNSIAKTLKDIFTASDKYLKEAGLWIKNNPEKYIIARNIGYTVEKPQLFYLKNKLTTSYLILDTSTGYFEHWGSTEATGRYKSSFTQQEIGSMETGSYELVPVEDGE